MTDRHGREIKAGDIIRIPHFRAIRRRMIYMYKLVVRVDDDLKISESGHYLYAVDIADIWKKRSLDKASKCRLSVHDDCEIIGCGSNLDDLWWERKCLNTKPA